MKLEDQVCSLELSKKLKELGFKQESLWYWINMPEGIQCDEGCSYTPGWKITRVGTLSFETASAYTVAELGEMLPKIYKSFKHGNKWTCNAYMHIPAKNGRTEANARAKMLIYLKKEGLLCTEMI